MTSAAMEETELSAVWRNAVAEDLRLLAVLHGREATQDILEELRELAFPAALGLKLQGQAGTGVLDFMRTALEGLPAPLEQHNLDDLAADYASIYLNHSLRASPCESVWRDEENLLCQGPMFEVREWYQRYGLKAADWRTFPDDHLMLQLQFVAHLLSLDNQQDTLRETARFLDEHLLRWVSDFAARVAARCATQFYAGLGMLTAEYLEELRDMLATLADFPRPTPPAASEEAAATEPTVHTAPLTYMPGIAPSW